MKASTSGRSAESIGSVLTRWTRNTVGAVLKVRPLPQHIGLIMDGNRRFAEQRRAERIEGHKYGYSKLIDALDWCLAVGVRCVSVYAFSIDNFRRSASEVDLLMSLAEDKLNTILQERSLIDRHKVQVRVLGDLTLAPAGVQRAAERVVYTTKENNGGILNICFSYTATEELTRALRCATGQENGIHHHASSKLDACLYTQACPPVDLLIRTSGETRLSDFLLWQSRHAQLVFSTVLWPDFSFTDLVHAIVQFQRSHDALRALGECASSATKILGSRIAVL